MMPATPGTKKTKPRTRKTKRRLDTQVDDASPSSQVVADCEKQIVDAIAAGTYRPSQRLGEVSVARELGCGQAIVRSAFDRLKHAGILYRKHRSGTYVRELSTDEYIDMCHVRSLLEGFACRMACRYATHEDLAHLEELAAKLDDLLDEHFTPDHFDEIEGIDLEFHCAIAKIGRNTAVVRILDNQQLILRLMRMSVLPPFAFSGQFKETPDHREIVETIRSRDPIKAEYQMRQHLNQCLRHMVRLDSIDLDYPPVA